VDIRPIDIADDAELRAAYDVMRRAALLGREGSPHWSFQEMAGAYRHPDSGERQDLLGGFVDGRLVGLAIGDAPLLDNLEKAWIGVHVDPPEQRRGHGGELLAAITELLAADGRTLLMGETKLPFAERETHG
jgi:GNAT superfamily N-acetyltransferase